MRFLSQRSAEIGLAVLVALAILLRLQPILVEPSAVWPDEIFQTSEPAHRLVFGSGLVAWEFQLGVRSWLLPGIIAGLMELSRIIGDGPDYYLPVIAVGFAALAAAPVVCCFLWCRPLFGVTGALLAGLAVAVAAEPVYFGARTLSETVAGHLLVVAIWALEPGYPVISRRRLFVGGALLGLVFATRVQLAPAIAVAMLWTNWRADRGRLAATLAGVAAILAAAGVLDTLTLGYPFASVWRYVLYNVFYGVSSTFGVEPWPYYLLGELGVWGGAGATMLLLTAIGAWRLPLLLVVAIVILAVHSGIAPQGISLHLPGDRAVDRARRGRARPDGELGTGVADRPQHAGNRSSRHQRRFGRGLVGPGVVAGVERRNPRRSPSADARQSGRRVLCRAWAGAVRDRPLRAPRR